jgi:pyruvate formate lyase activating enzyme
MVDAARSPNGGDAAEKRASCGICPHACVLPEARRGVCGAREARGGKVVPLGYGLATSIALDAIEKKPLARFRPGSRVLSIGGFGCNLDCPFCQNSAISKEWGVGQGSRRLTEVTPQQLVAIALNEVQRGNIGVAYTYNEPLVNSEFVMDCARLVREAGLLNVIVTNGYANEGPWGELLAHMDAANIDLKGFSPATYTALGAPDGLQAVKRSIAMAAGRTHLEVTTLIVPGMNDSPHEIDAMAQWLASLDPSIVLHVTRFFPHYRMSGAEPTPVNTVKALAEVARGHLQHVHTGNC